MTATGMHGGHHRNDDDDERDDDDDDGSDIRLASRDGGVLLGDSQLTASNDIRIRAEVGIVSTDVLLQALGGKSKIDLEGDGDVLLTGTTLSAVRTVHIAAHQSITIGNSAANEGLIQATDSRHGEVKLKTSHGDITAMGAVFGAIGNRNGKVELKADNIDIRGSRLEANKKVSLKARNAVFADDAFLEDLLYGGAVDSKARHDINLKRATLRAFKKIEVESKHGNVDLTDTDLAIVTGSTKGDIKVKGRTIDVTNASLLAPDKSKLKGSVSGTPAVIGKGTKDYP